MDVMSAVATLIIIAPLIAARLIGMRLSVERHVKSLRCYAIVIMHECALTYANPSCKFVMSTPISGSVRALLPKRL